MRSAKIILVAVSFIAGLLLCEALLSWVKPQVFRRPSGVWQFDARLGWHHTPGASGGMVSPSFAVDYRINAEGLRDREYPREKDPQTWRILAFGDSFAEGWGVEVEESVSKQLEERLREAMPQRKIEVINFGVAGYGTGQELLFFEEVGKPYQPDQVVLFFYPNDLWNNGNRQGIGAERGYKPFFRLGPDDRLQLFGVPVKKATFWDASARSSRPWYQRLDLHLRQHWHLYVLLDKALRPAPEISGQQRQHYYEGLYGTGDLDRWASRWELTGRLLQAFHTAVAQAGAELVLVYVPTIVQIEEEDWQNKRDLYGLIGEFDLLRPNRQIAGFAALYGIPLLDLYESFEPASQTQKLYYQDSHWTPQGHALAAALIQDYLLDQSRLAAREKEADRSLP